MKLLEVIIRGRRIAGWFLAIGALWTFLLSSRLMADDFTVDWHRIGLGSGTSSSEEFTVSGVIGESAVGESAAADEFAVTGGFGVVMVVPTEGAPPLSISSARDDSVVVYWPLPDTGWELRQSTVLDGKVWEKPPETLQIDGRFRFISVTPLAGTRFFRLFALDAVATDQDREGIPEGREAESGHDSRKADTDADDVPGGLEDGANDGLPNAWEMRYRQQLCP